MKYPRKERNLLRKESRQSKPENIQQLRQFLGTLNFYRRFIPEAAKDQALLNNLLSRPKAKKKKAPIIWNKCLEAVFVTCKESFSKAILLAHPKPEAKITLTTDASDITIGTVIQQRQGKEYNLLPSLAKNSIQHNKNIVHTIENF